MNEKTKFLLVVIQFGQHDFYWLQHLIDAHIAVALSLIQSLLILLTDWIYFGAIFERLDQVENDHFHVL